MQRPRRFPPTCSTGSRTTFCPPRYSLPNSSDLLILREQFSMHSAAVCTCSKANASIHHAERMLALKTLPDLSTPASPKSYYTRAHATREPKGCCSQNIKQTNWLPSNIPFFSQDDPSCWKAHAAFCRLENECVEFNGARLPSTAEKSSKGGKQNDSNDGRMDIDWLACRMSGRNVRGIYWQIHWEYHLLHCETLSGGRKERKLHYPQMEESG